MTNIYANNNLVATETVSGITTVSFNYLGNKVYSANKIESIYGVFISDVILASSNFIKWNNLIWEGQEQYSSSDSDSFSSSSLSDYVQPLKKVYLFVKTSDTETGLSTAKWEGPFFNGTNDISGLLGIYLQFMVILRNDGEKVNLPVVSRINVSYFSSDESVKFFTKAFDVGFSPRHILLTYNATNVTDETIIRFAISGEDTADTSKYLYIEPNKIQSLDAVSFDSNKIKIMMEMIGASFSDVTIDEFAVTFSGEGAFRLNEFYTRSSSSSSSISSSSSSSSDAILLEDYSVLFAENGDLMRYETFY